MRKFSPSVLLVVAILASLVATSCAPSRRVGPAAQGAYDDATISTRVKTALLNDPDIGALKIDVSTAQGVVTLSGEARTRGEEEKAVQLARKTPGVKDVRSALKVGG